MFGTYQSGRKWSECNRIDFEAHYLQNKDNWCMGDVTEADIKGACGAENCCWRFKLSFDQWSFNQWSGYDMIEGVYNYEGVSNGMPYWKNDNSIRLRYVEPNTFQGIDKP